MIYVSKANKNSILPFFTLKYHCDDFSVCLLSGDWSFYLSKNQEINRQFIITIKLKVFLYLSVDLKKMILNGERL